MTNAPGAEIVELLAVQEYTIGALYSAFSEALPETKQLWNNLVIQEKAHGDVMRQLGKMCNDQDVFLNTSIFNAAAIQTNIDSVRKQTDKVKEDGITEIRAFALASDIEHSLIESQYFKIIETQLPALKKELEEIQKHTNQHASLVDKHLQQARENQQSVEEI